MLSACVSRLQTVIDDEARVILRPREFIYLFLPHCVYLQIACPLYRALECSRWTALLLEHLQGRGDTSKHLIK